MRGQVLQAGPNGDGLILGADGNRYSFSREDWKGIPAPVAGDEVDFIAGDGRAGDIYPLPAPKAVPAAVAAAQTEGSSVMLGTIGILCLVLGFVIPVLPTIVAFIVGLVGADSAKRPSAARRVL
ncbi:MAG TPA: hypothetical protein GYA10_01840, partial [Alphaproteobacteria bacterium]|nr:hypothetical protein [Alphaproteobacteria bacterium]